MISRSSFNAPASVALLPSVVRFVSDRHDWCPGPIQNVRFCLQVLSDFLSKTEEYLHRLGSKVSAVKRQQEIAAKAAEAALASIEGQVKMFCLHDKSLLSSR